MSIKRKLTRNTIANYVGYFTRIVVNFFLFPFVVHRLGATEAGIWFLLSSITGYLGLLDLGVKPALVKHVAQHHAKGNKEAINEIINAAFFIFLLVGLVSGLAMIIIGIFFPHIFKVEPELIGSARACTYIVAIALFFSFPMSAIGGGILNGLQRYDKTRTSGMFSVISGAIAIVFLLYKGYGIVAIVLADQITNFLSWVINIFFAKRLAPYLRIGFRYLKKKVVKDIFKFSGVIFVMELASQAIYHLDRIVIGIFLNVGAIVVYEAAYKIYHTIARIPLLLVSAIMPASSELHAQNRQETLKRLYLYSTKYTIAFFLFLVIPVLIFTKAIINIWVGPGFENAALYTQLFLIVVFFVLNHSSSVQILMGMGKIKSIAWYQVITAILNITLSIILIKTIGLVGVILGTVIPFIFMEWFYLRKSFTTIGVSAKEYLTKVILKTYLPALIPTAILLVFSHYFYPNRLREIILVMVINFVIYGLLFYFFGMEKAERINLIGLLKKEPQTKNPSN